MTKDELEKEILERSDLTAQQKVEMIKVLKEQSIDKIPEPDDLLLG